MPKKIVFPILMLIPLIFSACNLVTTTTPSAIPTSTASIPAIILATPSLVPTSTGIPTDTSPAATFTVLPSNTPIPAASSTVPPIATPVAANYMDDRSTPSQVVVSFYNAIDRQEYSRAYGYYSDPATTLGPFSSFVNGYQNTVSVDLVFGQITGDPGMSQIHYTVPVILKAITKNNVHTTYAACYVVHESNPLVYGAPPISPMSIDSGSATVSNPSASDASVLANACSAYPSGGLQSFPASANSLSIDKNNFVDNRSGPIETVSSLLNSLNLKQYVRAYSYYQNAAAYPGPYDPYAAGYANTDTITVTFGTVISEGAAGSLYYKVPLAEEVLTTSSTTQTFVGCYTLRLEQPANQTTPPFQSMGITAGKFNQVANGTNVTTLLPSACN